VSSAASGPARYWPWASVLFLGTLSYYWVGTTPFIDLTVPTPREPTGSGALAQLIGICLFLASVAVLWMRRKSAAAMVPGRTLLVLLGWLVFTALIARYPGLAVRRVLLAALICVNASAVLLLPRNDRAFGLLMAMTIAFSLGLAYWGIQFLPSQSIHQANEVAEPMLAGAWRGHFIHKNVASAAMVVSTFFGLYIMKAYSRLVGTAILVAALFFLLHTGGKTSTASLPAILMLVWIMEKWKWSRIPLVCGGLVAFNIVSVGSVFVPGIAGMLEAVGIDPTFTNRADIWHVAMSGVMERPITGFGFQSFWQSDEVVHSGGETWAVFATSSHNAYVEMLLAAGLPGLILTIVWLVAIPLRDFSQAQLSGNSPELTRLFARIWLYGVLTGCLESVFFYQGGGVLWFSLLVAVFGLRLQARSQLAEAPAPAAATGLAYVQ
jgi:O-antigen ligase